MKIGEIKGKLTLLRFCENKHNRRYGIFKCECGNEKSYDVSAVKHGRPRQCFSCGRKSGGVLLVKHGLIKHPLYRKWQDMKKRCYNKSVPRYKNYGGMGVVVCDSWLTSFGVFYDWCMLNGWEKGLEIDRIDVYGNYEPTNCRFITKRENSFNKRNTFFVEVDGFRISLSELLYRNNKSKLYKSIWNGMKRGRSINYYIDKHLIKLPENGISKTKIKDKDF